MAMGVPKSKVCVPVNTFVFRLQLTSSDTAVVGSESYAYDLPGAEAGLSIS